MEGEYGHTLGRAFSLFFSTAAMFVDVVFFGFDGAIGVRGMFWVVIEGFERGSFQGENGGLATDIAHVDIVVSRSFLVVCNAQHSPGCTASRFHTTLMGQDTTTKLDSAQCPEVIHHV